MVHPSPRVLLAPVLQAPSAAVEDLSWLIIKTRMKSPAARVSLGENIITVERQKALAYRCI